MKKYLLVYSNNLGTREQLVRVLSGLPLVKGWRYDLPNSFYIMSEASSKELLNSIRSACGGNGRCVLVEMDNYYGWLPKETWEFIHKYDSKNADSK